MSIRKLWYQIITILIITVLHFVFIGAAIAQDEQPTPITETIPEAPDRVEVERTVRDDQIETRLQDILSTTGWFFDADVRVDQGVVFLTGETGSEDFKQWAGDLARNTQDVAAVVNQIIVIEPDALDFSPIVAGLNQQWRSVLRAFPLVIFSLIITIFAGMLSRRITRVSKSYLRGRGVNTLLSNVSSRAIGGIVLVAGLFLIFQVAGLTSIAFTILGGTGLLGLVVGIAFRDITENFLASIFLSVQNPFSVGDLVEIHDVIGFVQSMTTRTTIIMTLAGNHVQIPNATVYKSIIHNYTSNPNRRIEFIVGIGYDDSISLAQETIRTVLEEHPAVLNDPEHLVLVDNLGSSSVNLQIYFWLDGNKHSWLKVKSSVIRLVKLAIQDAGISMPDDAREVIFPQGIPIETISDGKQPHTNAEYSAKPAESKSVSTKAEGDLTSEAQEIQQQADNSRTPEAGNNLLEPE